MMQQQQPGGGRNLILAIVLSVAIILFFQLVFAPPPKPATTAQPGSPPAATQPGVPGAPPPPGTPPGTPPQPKKEVTRAEALKASDRVAIDAKRVKGSIALVGGMVDDLTLKDYRTEVPKTAPNIDLLNPPGIKGAYYVLFGWQLPQGAKPVELPTEKTAWTASGGPLAPGKPVTLTFTGKDGLKFSRRYEIDDNYLIVVTERVENGSDAPVALAPYAVTRLVGEPKTLGFFILHEGPIGVVRAKADAGGTINDPSYEDVRKGKVAPQPSTGGWVGFTDHYWLVALVPNPVQRVTMSFTYDQPTDTYATAYQGETVTLQPGGSAETVHRVYAGAKEVDTLQAYEKALKIEKFDWAIDFGWFWFLTRPFLSAIKWFYGLTGNFGIAILMLTIIVKLLFFPLANKSYKSMSMMKKVQPELVKLRERYGQDKAKLNQEMMALYKKEKINPAAGCFPILLQIPVFFALYKVLFVAIEMRHAPFFWWIQDLSVKDPTSIINLFGLLPWSVPAAGSFLDLLNIGVWPLIMGVTMWLQHKLNPSPPDPVQQKVFALMPWIFTVMLASFPAGLVIYWAWNNVLSIGQQYVIMKKYAAAKQPDETVPRNIKELEARRAKKAAEDQAKKA
jgi:YidC/Oxa1 family membrane protein insertase